MCLYVPKNLCGKVTPEDQEARARPGSGGRKTQTFQLYPPERLEFLPCTLKITKQKAIITSPGPFPK